MLSVCFRSLLPRAAYPKIPERPLDIRSWNPAIAKIITAITTSRIIQSEGVQSSSVAKIRLSTAQHLPDDGRLFAGEPPRQRCAVRRHEIIL